MKNRLAMQTDEHYFHPILPLGCWKPVSKSKQSKGKKLLNKYQTRLDTAIAGIAIGLMFLTGIWMFLEQLAACVSS